MSNPDDVLCWIIPRNAIASEALQHSNNRHYVTSLSEHEQVFVVALNGCASSTPGCLVTFGRNGDIEISGSLISSIQYQILLSPSTKEILLRDRSTFQSTNVAIPSHEKSLHFSMKSPRQVVLRPGDSVHVGMGGDNSSLFHFEILWPPMNAVKTERLEQLKTDFVCQPRKSRLALTLDDTATPGSRYASRIQIPEHKEVWLHRQTELLGSGVSGDVYKTVNMHTGDYYAVKVMKRTGKMANDSWANDISWRKDVLKEATTLQKLYHPNIAQYCYSQGFQAGNHPVEIFMFLYAGSVEDYIAANPARRREKGFLEEVFEHILRALMFIAHHDIIHRDVKPANILYHTKPNGDLQFVLADFGLSNEQALARTVCRGTPIYMAPEVSVEGARQSHKVDVYSMGVTMLAVGGAGGFDAASISTREHIVSAIAGGLRDNRFSFLAPMLLRDPTHRPSAQKFFLSIWHHDAEAINLPPKECDQALGQQTFKDENVTSQKRKRMRRTDVNRAPVGVIKARQGPSGIPKRLGKAPVERQKPKPTAQLFSGRCHGVGKGGFTPREWAPNIHRIRYPAVP